MKNGLHITHEVRTLMVEQVVAFDENFDKGDWVRTGQAGGRDLDEANGHDLILFRKSDLQDYVRRCMTHMASIALERKFDIGTIYVN